MIVCKILSVCVRGRHVYSSLTPLSKRYFVSVFKNRVKMDIWALSTTDFDSLFRAVHYVAAPKKESTETKEDGERRPLGDISNNVISSSNADSDKPPKNSDSAQHPATSSDSTTKDAKASKTDENERPTDVQKTPKERFRSRHLIVSDFVAQIWCEQQLAYNFDPPPGVVPSEKPQLAKGTDLHLIRELEVQDIVEVNITSREDAFALKLLNIMAASNDFASGDQTIRREIPIFGEPFQLGLFVTGIIDELRFDKDTCRVDVVELKTRKTARLPSKAQKITHDMQVMLYRRMWNELATGQLTKDAIIKHMQLNPEAVLGTDICDKIDFLEIVDKERRSNITLNWFLDYFYERIRYLPVADKLLVEYCHQETGQRYAVESIAYDEAWLHERVESSAGYWRGKREPYGVDIEEAWKCRFCDYNQVCSWRIKKNEEYAEKNRIMITREALFDRTN